MENTELKLFLLFVSLNQKEIINLLIQDTDAWAQDEGEPGVNAKARLMDAMPCLSTEDDNLVYIEDGEDNNLVLALRPELLLPGAFSECPDRAQVTIYGNTIKDIVFYALFV